MTSLIRVLAALAFAICLALPGVSGDGGENGGGTGVWVLPRASYLTSPTAGAPRDVRSGQSLAQDFVMQMSAEVGVATATFVDDVAGVPHQLPVAGLLVRIPAALLQSLNGQSTPTATVLIADATQMGYLIRVTVSNGSATISVQ